MSTTALRQVTDSDRFTEEQLRLITDTIMKGATAQEVQFFAEVCKRAGMDPFRRQIHAVQRWDNELKRKVWTYQTGIDGYRAIANRTGCYAGSDEPQYIPADESTPNPRKATVTVWKLVAGQRVPFTASARWEEYVQTTKEGNPNSMWRKMPYGQLGKCAEALALRKAFPEETNGIYTDVEMEQADSEGERGEQVKGKPSQFDLESRPFEKPAEAAPKPAETPASAKPQETVVEAEVVESLPVPEKIAKWTRGKWKEAMGDIKNKALADARQAAFESAEQDAAWPAFASIYDETQARIAAKGMNESHFADMVCASINEIEFPADLWAKPSQYPSILAAAKALK